MFNRFKKAILAVMINLCLIGALSFLFHLNINPADLDSLIGAKMGEAAATTINKASVSENPFNKLAMELSKKEKELNRYEDMLEEKEEYIIRKSSLTFNRTLMVLAISVLLLFLLVVLNFYFDNKRKKRLKKEKNKEERRAP